MGGSIIYEFIGSQKRPLDEKTLEEFYAFARKFLVHPEKYDLETIEDIHQTCEELLKRLELNTDIKNTPDHIETISLIMEDAIEKINDLSEK